MKANFLKRFWQFIKCSAHDHCQVHGCVWKSKIYGCLDCYLDFLKHEKAIKAGVSPKVL